MKRKYYSLLARANKRHAWYVQFGDYDKAVVEQELEDQEESGDFKYFLIIGTAPEQSAIDAEVARINAKEAQDLRNKALAKTAH